MGWNRIEEERRLALCMRPLYAPTCWEPPAKRSNARAHLSLGWHGTSSFSNTDHAPVTGRCSAQGRLSGVLVSPCLRFFLSVAFEVRCPTPMTGSYLRRQLERTCGLAFECRSGGGRRATVGLSPGFLLNQLLDPKWKLRLSSFCLFVI